jgi:hypothetical protein
MVLVNPADCSHHDGRRDEHKMSDCHQVAGNAAVSNANAM